MTVITSIENIIIKDELVIALGTFDGIHIGHLQILEDAVSEAKSSGLKSACLTFSNHPLNFIKGLDYGDAGSVRLLCSEEQKLSILESLGFDYVINIPFDKNIMTMRATDFIRNILNDKLHARILCCGFNYSFGDKAEGTVDTLRSESTKYRFKINAHDAVKYNNQVVSSTAVRALVREGNFELTNKYLGREYSISGKVIHGNNIGKGIGFPTINLGIPTELEMPPNGVYFSRAVVCGKEYKSITNIGNRPTVGKNDKVLETHIFDFDSEVYGDEICIKLLKYHRPEIKFDSIEELAKQITIDCKLASIYLGVTI